MIYSTNNEQFLTIYEHIRFLFAFIANSSERNVFAIVLNRSS